MHPQSTIQVQSMGARRDNLSIFLRALVGRDAPELMRKGGRVELDGKDVCVGRQLCCTAAKSSSSEVALPTTLKVLMRSV